MPERLERRRLGVIPAYTKPDSTAAAIDVGDELSGSNAVAVGP